MQLPPESALAPSTLRWSGLSDRGKVRKNNEDSFLCLQFDAQEVRYLGKVGEDNTEHNDFVFAVSDGMGGAHAGEFASKITVEKITRLLPRAYRHAAQGMATSGSEVLEELFDQIHKALCYLGGSYEECAGMGATLSLGWFTPGWMHFAHIGDSRIYYLPANGGGFRQITHDDTYVGWLYRQGKLNERELRNHPRKNVLQKALGAGHQFIEPQTGSVICEPGDRFLLCTDGVTDGLFDSALEDLLRHPGSSATHAQEVVKASLERSGKDNTTALIVEVVATAPTAG